MVVGGPSKGGTKLNLTLGHASRGGRGAQVGAPQAQGSAGFLQPPLCQRCMSRRPRCTPLSRPCPLMWRVGLKNLSGRNRRRCMPEAGLRMQAYPHACVFSLLHILRPWDGSYEITSALWAIAHTTRFASPGWSYLRHGSGLALLAYGGSYVTRISSDRGTCR